MQLPHQPVVFPNRADPADYGALRGPGDAADAIRAERFDNFLARLCQRGPNTERRECGVEQLCRVLDGCAVS